MAKQGAGLIRPLRYLEYRATTRALLDGANAGDSASAEEATGYRWGDPRLRGEVERLLEQAIAEENDRLEVLAERFLRSAG